MSTDEKTEMESRHSNRLPVHPSKHFPIARTIRANNGNPIPAQERSDGRAFACAQILEIQIAHHSRGVDDGHRNSRFLRRRVEVRQTLPARAEELHPANRCQPCY